MYRSYDVQCEDCGNVFEVFIGDDEEMPRCTECNSKNLKRLFNKFNFNLKYTASKDICAWGDNNYETSQYYRKVKEAEERTGKRHKTIYDD